MASKAQENDNNFKHIKYHLDHNTFEVDVDNLQKGYNFKIGSIKQKRGQNKFTMQINPEKAY